MSHRPAGKWVDYPTHGIIIANSGNPLRRDYLALAERSAKATECPVEVLDTGMCRNAGEAWDIAQFRAKALGWEWWMPLGDDDVVSPFWGEAFKLGYREALRLEEESEKLWVKSKGKSPEVIPHWRITCTAMQVIDANGVPLGIIETPPMGWHRTKTVEELGGYGQTKPDGSWSDVYLCQRAIHKGYATVLAEAVWYCYRTHGQSQSNVDARFGPLINYAKKTGDHMKIVTVAALQESPDSKRQSTIVAERKLSAMLNLKQKH